MGFVDDVRQGECGLRFAPPTRLETRRQTGTNALLFDNAHGTNLSVAYFPHRLDLRPEHEQLLRRGINRHTRELFESCFRSVDRPDKQVGARTDDPIWSPVVDVSMVCLGLARALRVIHRSWYEPGCEIVVGHLLVPLARGTFEFRIEPPPLARTGKREAAALSRLLLDAAKTNPNVLPTQIDQRASDDASLDAAFPDHPLSLVRKELSWLVDQGGIEVIEAARDASADEDEVTEADFAIEPPPRFLRAYSDKPSAKRASWSRVSFSGTDGIELLTVSRTGTRLDRVNGRALARIAEAITKTSVPKGATSVQVSARALEGKAGEAHAETYRAHVEGTSRQHSLFRWFTDKDHEVVMVAIGAAQCVPMAELEDEAAQVVASFRRLSTPSREKDSAKKWWQIFR